MKLEKLGLSPATIIGASIMIIMGFGTYYLAPLAFFINDFSLFLFLLNLLLIIMIIGMIFMLQLVTPYLEKLLLEIIMLIARKDRNVKFIIHKNLEGHFIRNQKTSIMFMIALSFTIFAGCTLELVANFIKSGSENIFGGNIWLWQNDGKDTLDEVSLNDYITGFNEKYNTNLVINKTFISYPLEEILGHKVRFSNIGDEPHSYHSLLGVGESYLYTVFLTSYSYNELNKDLKFTKIRNSDVGYYDADMVRALYDNIGYSYYSDSYDKSNIKSSHFNFSYYDINYSDKSYYNNYTVHPQVPIVNSNELKYKSDLLILVAEGLRNTNSFSTKKPVKLTINKNPTKSYKATIVAMPNKIAGFIQISSYSYLAQASPILTSLKQFKEIVEIEAMYDPILKSKLESQSARTKTFDNIRKKYCFIKLNKDNQNEDMRKTFIQGLKNLINTENTELVNVDSMIEEASSSAALLDYLFIAIGIIALILSFFLIWISFYSNIRDNICEFGIMRAIGVDKNQTTRMYLYEAGVLILSAIIIGTLIGMVVSSTLVLQFNLFLELPFKLAFPLRLYLILCILGVVFSLLGSYYPTSQVNNLPLVKILKGLID